MSDETKKPGDRAAAAPRPDEEEQWKLHEIDDDELQAQLKKHKGWLESVEDESEEALEQQLWPYLKNSDWDKRPGANLQKTILEGVELQETECQESKLQWANFRGANLQRADFRRAELHHTLFFKSDLRKADLRNTNLAKADLQRADLREAQLLGANLREANLQDADLRHVTGLLGKQLAGANVSGVKLSGDIAEFKGLDQVTEISKHARNIFLAVIGGCVFSWLTIVTTTDVALLTNTASTPLPIIQTKVPIAGFYLAAPLILWCLYIYLHMYLQRLWSGLAGLPAIFPDGRTLDERAYPWLLTSLVGKYVPRLKEDRPPFSRQQVFLSILTAWCLVPLTIGWFWLRYLPVHDWIGTGVHIALVALTVTHGVGYFWRAQATLRGCQLPKISWKIWRSPVHYAHVVLALGLLAAASVVSYGAINGVRSLAYTERRSLVDPPPLREMDLRSLVPRAFALIGYSPFADLRDADVSTKSENWRGAEKDVALVIGANLKGSDLWSADAVRAFLVKADLRDANLQRVDFHYANLQGAVLTDAKIKKADFGRANLRDADLTRAKLQGARLFGATLQGATLDHADLTKADLRGANFSGANLGKTWGLTQDQLDEACGNAKTQLPEHLEGYKMKPCPEKPK